MPDSLWDEIRAILWVRAAGGEKLWLGLCDRWSSCDNQTRWQTRAFRMLGEKKKVSLLCHYTGTHSSAPQPEKGDQATLPPLSKGFDNRKGMSGGYNEGTRKISFKKKKNKLKRILTTGCTKGIYHKSHSANFTHTSRLMWTFHSSLQSAEEILPNPLKWWQVLLFLLAAKPPSSPNLLQWQCRRKIKGEEIKEPLTWLSWIPVTENQVDGSFTESRKASMQLKFFLFATF